MLLLSSTHTPWAVSKNQLDRGEKMVCEGLIDSVSAHFDTKIRDGM